MYIYTICTYNIFCKINKTLHYMAGPIWTFGFLNRTFIHGPFKGLLYVQRVYLDFSVGSFVKREDIFNPRSMLKFNAISLEGSRCWNYGAQIRQAKKKHTTNTTVQTQLAFYFSCIYESLSLHKLNITKLQIYITK